MQVIEDYYLIYREAFSIEAKVVCTTNMGQTYTTDSF